MHGVCLKISYDGSAFAGWQSQRQQRTIQDEMERVLQDFCGHAVRLRAAGRTDAGVHAEGQVAAFDCAHERPAGAWTHGVNRLLPPDISITGARACAPAYNPRFDAVYKDYRYLILETPVKNPFWFARTWQLRPKRVSEPPLDIEAMRGAAHVLSGTHDFTAFRGPNDASKTTIRTIHSIDIRSFTEDAPRLWSVHVRGTAFMQHMVRIITGTLVEVGRARMSLDVLQSLLRGDKLRRDNWATTAPAQGLTLKHVELGRKASSPFHSQSF